MITKGLLQEKLSPQKILKDQSYLLDFREQDWQPVKRTRLTYSFVIIDDENGEIEEYIYFLESLKTIDNYDIVSIKISGNNGEIVVESKYPIKNDPNVAKQIFDEITANNDVMNRFNLGLSYRNS